MLTKIPDYIISDCGYPEWKIETEKLNLGKIHEKLWSKSSLWSTRTTNFAKLLPLRETLTDYYIDKLMIRQSESSYKATATKSTQHCNKNHNRNAGRQAAKHMNEVLKSSKRKQYQQQQCCSLDKRRSYVNNADKEEDIW